VELLSQRQLTREEQDPTTATASRNRVSIYQDGKLVAGARRPRRRRTRRRITRYDAQQRVVQRDEDQDGDGLVDARAYYEEGRLVRHASSSARARAPRSTTRRDLTSAQWSSEPNEAHP
jgi:hypothetical protein